MAQQQGGALRATQCAAAAAAAVAPAAQTVLSVAAAAVAGQQSDGDDGSQLEAHQQQLAQARGGAVAVGRGNRAVTLLSARALRYALPAALSHFGPSLGVAVVDNLFGAMTGTGSGG
jgi:hypothetical protein